jgi:hypothetical protein
MNLVASLKLSLATTAPTRKCLITAAALDNCWPISLVENGGRDQKHLVYDGDLAVRRIIHGNSGRPKTKERRA